MLRTKKLIVWSLLAIPVLVLAVNLSLAKKPVPPPPLPQVMYRIKHVQLPVNSDGVFVLCPAAMNNPVEIGNLLAVGWFQDVNDRATAFLYDPTIDPNMNTDRDLVTRYQVYRDDLGWVALDDLVVGTETDLARWHQSAFMLGPHLGDRKGEANAGLIVTGIVDSAAEKVLVILTPEV